MKRIRQNLSEVSAEMLLHYLYPDMDDKWTVEHQGTFFRNFNRDVLAYDEETGELQVARDSFIKLLPPGMLFSENSLEGKGQKKKIENQEERKRLLQDLFQPLDNLSFHRKMEIEREVSALLDSRQDYVLTTFFDYDLEAENNPYIKEMAKLLPLVRNIRGDYRLIRNMLASLFDCEVNCHISRYSDTDQTRSWIPEIRYELLIEGLTPETYDETAAQLEELRQFLQEWFFPFDAHCVMNIKWHHQSWNDSDHWLLDYNTELNQE